MNIRGNFTRPRITADLEAMKRIGLGGTLFMNVGVGRVAGRIEKLGRLLQMDVARVC